MVNFTILAGGYSTAIATYVFNSDSKTLSFVGNSTSGEDPSWITLHPTNSSILYATNEGGTGHLQSFVINSDTGLLSDAVSTVSSGGNAPAYAVGLSSGQVAVMNYNTGTGMIIPTNPDPLHFDNSSASVITLPASNSHPHMALQHDQEVLVPDVGADRIWRLVQNSTDTPGGWHVQGAIEQPEGSGTRHIRLSDGYLYALHEYSNTLTSQQLPAAPNGTSSFVANLTVVPPDIPQGANMSAPEILIPATNGSFTGSFIYCSNLNTGDPDPRGDAIAIFSRTGNGGIEPVGYVFTGLQKIRGMQFFGENDQYLIAGGQSGNAGVIVYERTNDGGNLTKLAQNTEVPTRTSFVWYH